MDAAAVNRKIADLQDYLAENPNEYSRLTNDRAALLQARGFEPELLAQFKVTKVEQAGARGCKCSSMCGFGCFYGPKVGCEGESCVG